MAAMDGAIVGIVSLLVGALAIHVAASVVLSGEQDYLNAVVAAAVGALVYSLFGFVGGIPLVGPVLLLLLWVGVINWRYPGGWVKAAIIGAGAWVAAIGILWLLSVFGLFELSAMGVPSA
ncbi:MAG: hypothetical protein ABEH90_06085 [Halolamina sp.]